MINYIKIAMLNIVIPMAGLGTRFRDAGYVMPKPLIDIYGHPMIEYVTKNLTPLCEHRFIYICLKEHLVKYSLKEKIRQFSGKEAVVIPIEKVTEGAACTVLLAKEYINNENELMIANSDQFVNININNYTNEALNSEKDGLIMTMIDNNPKWSFVLTDKDNNVVMVKEKEVISNEATVGIYNFKKGKEFVYYASRMIEKNIRVNNEFYVAPVYNEMILDDKKVGVYNIGDVGDKMYGLGVPEDLDKFVNLDLSKSYFDKIHNQ